VLLLIVLAGGVVFVARGRMPPPAPVSPRLTWVATAQQFGPVGYRDPAGAISPDGRWIAYSEGRFLRVRPLDGGPSLELPPGPAQIRRLVWDADSRSLVADGEEGGGWVRFDRVTRTREPVQAAPPLLKGRNFNDLLLTAANQIFSAATSAACIDIRDGRRVITKPCGGDAIAIEPATLVPYGPLAMSPDALTIYFAAPNDAGTVDLWSVAASGGRASRLTSFARDTYAPSLASDGTLLFKVQSYRTVVAQAPADGGPSAPLATFRSETPSWDPTASSSASPTAPGVASSTTRSTRTSRRKPASSR
jgi:hypothetical protein